MVPPFLSHLITGIDKIQYYKEKFGAHIENSPRQKETTDIGAKYGLDLHLTRGSIGNTFDAHRLLAYVNRTEGWQKQNEVRSRCRVNEQKPISHRSLFCLCHQVLDQVFKAYHEKEQDISFHNTLADAATDTGLDRQRILDFLKSDDEKEWVAKKIQEARDRGVRMVPTFVFNDREQITGGQDPEVFVQHFGNLNNE
jgi:predicted DsbA family dithiol-disulfide isomerase